MGHGSLHLRCKVLHDSKVVVQFLFIMLLLVQLYDIDWGNFYNLMVFALRKLQESINDLWFEKCCPWYFVLLKNSLVKKTCHNREAVLGWLQFQGFLEPPMDDGYLKKWRHWTSQLSRINKLFQVYCTAHWGKYLLKKGVLVEIAVLHDIATFLKCTFYAL